METTVLKPSSYIGGVLQEITPIVKDSITYSKANEQTPGKCGGGGLG